MDWVKNYQLFLFDFDGLLVDTEQLHYQAYLLLCQNHDFVLPWDFKRFCQVAHFSAHGLRDEIYKELPGLMQKEGNWDVLYKEKKRIYSELLRERGAPLMPGVDDLLKELEKLDIKRAVVTHSPSEHIKVIRDKNPILDTIPHWITREQYERPKPSSDCYNLAIERYASPNDRVIGFEDSPRGLQALRGTRSHPVLINEYLYDLPKEYQDVKKFSSFKDIRIDDLH